MRLSSCSNATFLRFSVLLYPLILILSACGGGGGGAGPDPFVPARSSSSSVSSSFSSASSSSSLPAISNPVTISGTVTYDFIPYDDDYVGLDYSSIEVRPVRGAVVELVEANQVVATAHTDDDGFYSAVVEADSVVRVQAKAQLKRDQTPAWNMTVNDNTNNNRLYALVGADVNVGSSDSQRNLHAPSGWNTGSYETSRPAAPFAILDSVYTGLQQFVAAGYNGNFPPLQFRWSTRNITASNPNDDFSTGEIGTSFYFDEAIYVLGEANQDTDENDAHVIVHEWGHYIEDALARADSIGGPHGQRDHLDMRVAYSEGFSNAFAAMMLDDPIYRDSNGFNQSASFFYDVSERNHVTRGWFSEASVESVLYNYFTSNNNKTAKDFSPILTTITDSSFYNADSLVSIFLFADRLLANHPGHRDLFESLLDEQNINSVNEYAIGETNDGGNDINLPVYKTLSLGSPTNVCSTSQYTDYNKLGIAQFLYLEIDQRGDYGVRVERVGGDFVAQSDPDFTIYLRGEVKGRGISSANDVELATVNLTPGNYIVEVSDYENVDDASNLTTCFNVSVARQ